MRTALALVQTRARPMQQTRAIPATGARTARLQRLLIRVFDDLATWQERAAQRRRLLAMDDRMLRDIGVDSGAALSEGFKPFWRD